MLISQSSYLNMRFLTPRYVEDWQVILKGGERDLLGTRNTCESTANRISRNNQT